MAGRTPNLFLVGAMRSGTTALNEVLAAHPDVFMSSVKEPAHFTDPAELATDSRVAADAGFAGNRTAYLELFRDAGDVTYVGESSTHYTKQPSINGVPDRIAAMSPDARIIYLVRDPVQRTLSHYRYRLRVKDERRPCLEALQAEPLYCATSDYAMQIAPFVDRFGEDRVRIVVFEEVIDNPVRELTSLYDWLGVATSDGVLDFRQRNEVVGAVARPRGPAVLHKIGMSAHYQRVAKSLLPLSLRMQVRRVLNSEVTNEEIEHEAVLAYLRAVHTPQVATLEELLGRRIHAWQTLRPASGAA